MQPKQMSIVLIRMAAVDQQTYGNELVNIILNIILFVGPQHVVNVDNASTSMKTRNLQLLFWIDERVCECNECCDYYEITLIERNNVRSQQPKQ